MCLSTDGMQVEAWLKRPPTKSKALVFLGGGSLNSSKNLLTGLLVIMKVGWGRNVVKVK